MRHVYLVPHNPSWAGEFTRESAAVADAMGEALIAIHHIGSTAIAGISAKPIIDLLAVVRDVAQLDAHDAAMQVLGYEVMGEFGIPGRRYFRKNDARGNRTHHVHAFAIGSQQIERHLAFRDFLRAHPQYGQQYEALKQSLAALYPHDVAAYTSGKDEFIQQIDKRAAVWRSGVSPIVSSRP